MHLQPSRAPKNHESANGSQETLIPSSQLGNNRQTRKVIALHRVGSSAPLLPGDTEPRRISPYAGQVNPHLLPSSPCQRHQRGAPPHGDPRAEGPEGLEGPEGQEAPQLDSDLPLRPSARAFSSRLKLKRGFVGAGALRRAAPQDCWVPREAESFLQAPGRIALKISHSEIAALHKEPTN
ncbi:hypothetical protein EYF80_045227 [Liparis tanakae]|uniref:Uncharacterized protein n=1 Tax=Liparis tanakae TaxID=230148 RepID=A0A4Z2FUS3_9TELE|nr:hypothetical protein EYF80_045227 [Liparis tanakae]